MVDRGAVKIGNPCRLCQQGKPLGLWGLCNLCTQGESKVESLAVVVRSRTEPERIHTVVARPTATVVQVFIVGVVGGPPRSRNTRHGLTRIVHPTDDISHDIGRPSGHVRVQRTLDAQHGLDVPTNVRLADIAGCQQTILFRRSLKLRVGRVHNVTDTLQIELVATSVANAEQLTGSGTMGRSEGISTYHANRSEPDPNRGRAIVRVTEQKKLGNLVTGHDFGSVAVQLRQHPNLSPTVERSGSVERNLARVDERLKPIERGTVLERLVSGADNTQNTAVSLTNGRASRNALAVSSKQVLQTDSPVQTGGDDSIANGGGRLQPIAQTVPRGFLDVKHAFDCVSHDANSCEG